MKNKIGLLGVAVIATTLFFNASILNGQPNSEVATSMVESCTEAYNRCNDAHPTSWRGFNTCMHKAAACPME